MSAAEAHTGHQTAGEHAAEVFPFRRPRRQRRETSVPVPSDSPLTPQQKLAATLERLYADHGRSLTDEDTATDFTIAIKAVLRLLEGAREQEHLTQEGYAVLDGMLHGMLEAPRLLA